MSNELTIQGIMDSLDGQRDIVQDFEKSFAPAERFLRSSGVQQIEDAPFEHLATYEYPDHDRQLLRRLHFGYIGNALVFSTSAQMKETCI